MYRIVIRVDASDISELINNIPTLRGELGRRYECSGTTTSFICVSDNDMLIKVIPTLMKAARGLKSEESLVPSPRPYLIISIEGSALNKLLEAWNLITEVLKSVGLRYVLAE